MFKKIKKYFELKKMRKDAATLLLIEGAQIITNLKNITELFESSATEVINPENIKKVNEFMNELMQNPSFNDKFYEKIHDDSQKLRELKMSKTDSKE